MSSVGPALNNGASFNYEETMGNLLHMKTGKINVSDLAKKINKKMGMEVAHDLSNSDPVSVKDWIPTGSKWLDCIIAPGS